MNKNNFVIVSGSDGSGKTTIANRLSEVTEYQVKHFGPPGSHDEGKKTYFDFVKNNTHKSIITDRFHEGERIYAPIYRGYKATYFRELEEAIAHRYHPLYVLVYAPFDIILKRIEERGEDFVKPEDLEYCYKAMLDEFNDCTLPKVMIDTSMETPYKNVQKILEKLYL